MWRNLHEYKPLEETNTLRQVSMPEVAENVACKEEALRGCRCIIYKFCKNNFLFKKNMWQYLIGLGKRVSIIRCTPSIVRLFLPVHHLPRKYYTQHHCLYHGNLFCALVSSNPSCLKVSHSLLDNIRHHNPFLSLGPSPKSCLPTERLRH